MNYHISANLSRIDNSLSSYRISIGSNVSGVTAVQPQQNVVVTTNNILPQVPNYVLHSEQPINSQPTPIRIPNSNTTITEYGNIKVVETIGLGGFIRSINIVDTDKNQTTLSDNYLAAVNNTIRNAPPLPSGQNYITYHINGVTVVDYGHVQDFELTDPNNASIKDKILLAALKSGAVLDAIIKNPKETIQASPGLGQVYNAADFAITTTVGATKDAVIYVSANGTKIADNIQLGLDIFSLTPVIGVGGDAANIGISITRLVYNVATGNYRAAGQHFINAGFSTVGIAPGFSGGSLKIGKNGIESAIAGKSVDDIIIATATESPDALALVVKNYANKLVPPEGFWSCADAHVQNFSYGMQTSTTNFVGGVVAGIPEAVGAVGYLGGSMMAGTETLIGKAIGNDADSAIFSSSFQSNAQEINQAYDFFADKTDKLDNVFASATDGIYSSDSWISQTGKFFSPTLGYGQAVKGLNRIIGAGENVSDAAKINNNLTRESVDNLSSRYYGKEILYQYDNALNRNYYYADGFKVSDEYYNKLISEGRPGAFLVSREIIDSNHIVMPDPKGEEGFFKYISGGWELVYNPNTGEIRHLQPIR